MDQLLAIVLEAANYGTADRIILILSAIGVGLLVPISALSVWRRP